MKRECETCVRNKLIYCPSSIDCLATDDKPYYQNKIMILEENWKLRKQLEEKENKLQKKVVYYEKQLKGTERSGFYYSSYLKNIHKLNAQRELIKEILSKIEKE